MASLVSCVHADPVPMTEHGPPDPKDLDARLERAQRQREAAGWGADSRRSDAPMSGFGLAMRIAVELVASLVVGVGIGWALDHWLGTRPWMMLLFFILGVVAGGLNVYRVVARLGDQVGFPRRRDGEGQ